MRFEGGRAVEIDADEGAETLRTIVARDEGAARLGEVALVDGEGRIGKLDTVFYDTLLDENAASHIALGQGYPFAARRGATATALNESEIHIDFMIGSTEVDGHRASPRDGERVPVLRERRLADLDARYPARAAPGEVPERLNGHDWKSCDGGQPRPRVRIPPSPLHPRSLGTASA